MRTLALSLTLITTALAGCASTVYAPGQAAGFTPDPDYEVTDKDIQRAFKARPQLRGPIRVAFFSLDPRKVKEIRTALAKVPGVTTVYAIPSLLVTGQRRFAPRHGRPPLKRAPSIKKMRLLAARARCNLLLIFDHEYRVRQSANWLVAFNVLLVTSLFVPNTDTEVESHLTAYLVDVGNGYLYGQIDGKERQRKRYTSLFSTWHRGATRRNFQKLLKQSMGKLSGLLQTYSRPLTTARR